MYFSEILLLINFNFYSINCNLYSKVRTLTYTAFKGRQGLGYDQQSQSLLFDPTLLNPNGQVSSDTPVAHHIGGTTASHQPQHGYGTQTGQAQPAQQAQGSSNVSLYFYQTIFSRDLLI